MLESLKNKRAVGTRFLTFRQLETVCGIPFCRAQIFRMVKSGKFPTPVKLGPKTNVWPEAEIDNWCKRRIAERRALNANEEDAGAGTAIGEPS